MSRTDPGLQTRVLSSDHSAIAKTWWSATRGAGLWWR